MSSACMCSLRQNVTDADRQHARNYERGDVLRYSKGSKPFGIEPGEYAHASHAQFDVQMYTNGAKALGYELSRDVSHPTAIQQEPAGTQRIEPQSESIQAAQGLSAG